MLKASTHRARNLRRRSTPAEMLLWRLIRGRQLSGAKFRRQQPLGPYIVDFYCDEFALVVELDGAPHFPPPPCDIERDAFMRKCGITVLRIENRTLLDSPQRVLARIKTALAPFSLREKGRG
jgi:very-short-patch-repair endonuclease